MVILQITVALIFIVIMITAKKKWMIPAGWALIFVAGTLLYTVIYSFDSGRIDLGIVFSAAISSIRNFIVNNDFAGYAGSVGSNIYLAASIVCLLSVFMTILTAAKIVLSHFSGHLYLLFFGKSRHICVFTDTSTDTVHLARSINNHIKKPLCVFLNCGRTAELESGKNILFLKDSAGKRLGELKSEVFICSEDDSENLKMYEKLSRQLAHSRYYVFTEHCEAAVNKEELLVRYLLVADKFIPAKLINNTRAQICIIGDNKLAVELCKELIVQCQNITGLPQITIVGADAEDNFAFFTKSNLELSDCAELTFVNAPPMSVAGIKALTESEYHLYFFCDGNKNLPSLIPAEKTVELPEYKAVYDYDVIVNFSLDKEAKELNAEYERNYGKGKSGAVIDAGAEWMKLSEFHRQSNRSQAINIPSKKHLHSIGVSLEQLAIEEHLRWNAFHYVNGWTYGSGADGKKEVKKKLHPCLVPYDELSQDEKDKDMLFIKKTVNRGGKTNA